MVTGYFYGTATFGAGEDNETDLISAGSYDIFVAKYDASGVLQWAKKAGGTSDEYGERIATDGSGNSLVTGFFHETTTFGAGEDNEIVLTSAGSYDIFVAKYNASGVLQWAKKAGGTSSDYGRGIATDGSGNSLVTGSFYGTATFDAGEDNEIVLTSIGMKEIFVAKYDASGALVWAKKAGGISTDRGYGIATDGSGNSLVTGSFIGTATFDAGEPNETDLISAGNTDIFVAKYSPDGTFYAPTEYPYVIISGYVKYSNNDPIEGVEIAFSNSGLTATTDVAGYYERFITKGWGGTATPSLTGFYFSPGSRTYSSIQTNMPNQDYIGEKDHITISGYVRDGSNIGVEGVNVSFSNGGATVITSESGYYVSSFTNGWGGTSTATKDGWAFTPVSYTYPVVTSNLTDQDYVGIDLTLAVNDILESLPTEFALLPAYPNPFNPSTTISYGLVNDSHVNIDIYGITGQLVTTLQNRQQTQRWHSVVWNGTNKHGEQVPVGIYLSRIATDNEVRTTKLMLLK